MSDILSLGIREQLENILSTTIQNISPCSGGCINSAATLTAGRDKYFVKWNTNCPKDMFHKEAHGLACLRETKTIKVPEVISVADNFLLLEHLNTGPTDYELFGEQLAKLHSLSTPSFGFEEDNYIGVLPQKNTLSDTWGEFFVDMRLGFQIELAIKRWADTTFGKNFHAARPYLVELLNKEDFKPCYVHGDLWSGNLMFSSEGPALIDPAVYMGVGEVDTAFLHFFGSPPASFWEGYSKILPRRPSYSTRERVYNFYHELTHANMFGGHYQESVRKTLNWITKGN